MCEPMTILAIGSAVGGAMGQRQQAKAVNAANEQQAENIRVATIDNYGQANSRSLEDRQNASSELSQIAREKGERMATARTAAAAGGIEGNSVDALLLDLAGRSNEAGQAVEINYARTAAANADQASNIHNTARSQTASLRPAAGPGALDYLGAGLRVAAGHYQQQNAQTRRLS